jgi:hypothetical protein
MASHATPRIDGFLAEGDLSAKQFFFVVFGATDDAVVSAGAGVAPIGILQNAPTAGKPAEVAKAGGGAKLKLSGTVTRGDFVKSDTTGTGLAATNGDKYGAQAMQSGVTGDVIAVEVVIGELET